MITIKVSYPCKGVDRALAAEGYILKTNQTSKWIWPHYDKDGLTYKLISIQYNRKFETLINLKLT